ELSQFREDLAAACSGRKQPGVGKSLDPHAAETNQHNRSPLRVATSTDDHFEAWLRHFLDEYTVEQKTRLCGHDLCVQLLPGCAQRLLVGDVDDDAADVALV